MSQVVIETVRKQQFQAIKKMIFQSFAAVQEVVTEDQIVESLRLETSYRSDFELVALKDGDVVGHGMLSEVKVGQYDGFLALAPLTVAVDHQGQGIGGTLIAELESRAKSAGYRGILILGDPDYYQCFSYQEAQNYGITCPFEVPSRYFMIKSLTDGLEGIHGQAVYLESLT